jgi:hypothetical protein
MLIFVDKNGNVRSGKQLFLFQAIVSERARVRFVPDVFWSEYARGALFLTASASRLA